MAADLAELSAIKGSKLYTQRISLDLESPHQLLAKTRQ